VRTSAEGTIGGNHLGAYQKPSLRGHGGSRARRDHAGRAAPARRFGGHRAERLQLLTFHAGKWVQINGPHVNGLPNACHSTWSIYTSGSPTSICNCWY
jgi:hypothetical protein